MSLYKDASLVMIPSAYKDGKLYSIRPTDGSGDFTFSRGSNLAATRVDVNGLIEKGYTNELLQSEDLENAAWIKSSGVVVTNNAATAPDGSNTAIEIDLVTTNKLIGQTPSLSGIVSSSIYIKGTSGETLSWNIGGVGVTITLDGTWQEFTREIQNWGTNAWNISNFNATTATLFYVWHPQLNAGLVSMPYVATTTAPAQAGILEDMPRLDYSGGASCPSLLLEPQRSNLIDNSEYFDAWIKSNISVANNVSTSPEGVQNATTIDVVSAASFSSLRRVISVSANSTYTMSLFVKKEISETNYMGIGFVYSGGTTDVGYVIIDSVNGTALSADPRIDVITNVVDFGDYWRVEATATDSGSNTTLAVYIYGTLSTNGTSVGVGTGSTRTIYGAQLESGSYPTSYIPTYGASVTRSGEGASITNASSIIGQTQGTIFVDYDFDDSKSNNGGSDNDIIQLTNSSYDFVKISHYGDGSSNYNNKVYLYQRNNSVYESTISSAAQSTGRMKVAVVYRENYYALFLNGVKIGEDTSASVPVLDEVYLNKTAGSVQVVNPRHQAMLFKTALTDAECIALTTL